MKSVAVLYQHALDRSNLIENYFSSDKAVGNTRKYFDIGADSKDPGTTRATKRTTCTSSFARAMFTG